MGFSTMYLANLNREENHTENNGIWLHFLTSRPPRGGELISYIMHSISYRLLCCFSGKTAMFNRTPQLWKSSGRRLSGKPEVGSYRTMYHLGGSMQNRPCTSGMPIRNHQCILGRPIRNPPCILGVLVLHNAWQGSPLIRQPIEPFAVTLQNNNHKIWHTYISCQ